MRSEVRRCNTAANARAVTARLGRIVAGICGEDATMVCRRANDTDPDVGGLCVGERGDEDSATPLTAAGEYRLLIDEGCRQLRDACADEVDLMNQCHRSGELPDWTTMDGSAA